MFRTNRSLLRGLTAVFALCLALPSLQAGSISGRVSDAERGGYLPGASVTIVESGRSTTTDGEGRFRLTNVAGGSVTLKTDYLGYSDVVQTVTVPQDGDVPVAISMGEDVMKLEQFVVEGYREGKSKALQQKKTANNLQDIISSDSVGNLPDRNVAEALARVPGVNLDVVEGNGEGRFISLRGIEPNFNTVTLNGSTLAAPTAGGREGRAMPLDVISSSQISQIEVVKAVTPDMDGNALGGSINIKTASGFDRRERFIFGKAELGKNNVADDNTYLGEFTYGNTFNNGTVGVALSANYSLRPYVSHDLQANWGTLNGRWYPSTLELQPATGEKERLGFNGNFEFRPDVDTEWYVRLMYNKFNQDQREQEFIMEARRDPVFIGDGMVTFNRMRYEQRDFRREIDQTLTSLSVGGKKVIDDLTVSGEFAYSRAEEDVPFIKSVQFRSGNINHPSDALHTVDYREFRPVYMNAINTPSLYPLRRFREEDSLRDEKTWSPRFDVRKDYDNLFGDKPGFVQVGAKYVHRDRIVDDNSVRPTNSSLTMANIVTQKPGFSFQEGRYMYPSEIDVNEAFEYLNANRSSFNVDAAESASNSIEDDYDTTEKILAAYVMASVDVSDTTTILGGVRWERTDADILGYEYQELDGDFLDVVTNTGSFSYNNILPNLQGVWRLTERSVIRAAITGTIGRPQYEKAAPKSVLEIEEDVVGGVTIRSGALEIGNPDLKPYESLNFDLSYEYYMPQGGLFSIAGFHKKIDNPIYEFSLDEQDVTYNGFVFDSLSTVEFRNANSAKVTGVEVNLQLPLVYFAQVQGTFFDGFGIDANATYIKSSTDVFERTGEVLPFFRQPQSIYNGSVYYEKYGFSARVAYNRQTESLRSLGSNSTNDQWDLPREYVDFQASYRVTENFTIYVDWQNITESRSDRSYGHNTGRMRRSEYYGSYVRGGVRFNF